MKTKKTKGQVLVIVTLMLIGLVAVLALVLDGGSLYTHRRAAQLAADAGALAGARAYCMTDEDEDRVGAALNSAQHYVDLNDADLVNASVENGTGDVTVDTSISFSTFFLHILGRDRLTANASATAGCTPPTSGIGIMPIAWSCRPPESIPEDEDPLYDCDMYPMDYYEKLAGGDGDGVCTPGEDPVYIVIDSDEISDEIVCMDPPPDPGDPSPEEPEGVDYVNCDINGDGVNDLNTISGGNKSWLDLDGGGGGEAELFEWVENGLGETIEIHTWFQGQSGTGTSVYKKIHQFQLGNDVIIPVFDLFCDDDPRDDDSECEYHEDDDTVIGGDIPGFTYYHVISFALFRVECVDGAGGTVGPEGCPARNLLEEYLDLGPQVKTVEGCFIEGFDPGLGGGGGSVDVGAEVIYLKR